MKDQGDEQTKPPDGANNVKFNQGAWSARYGLNQTTGVDEFRITPGFTGDIGDPANGFYLILDVDNASPKSLFINKTKGRVWMTCTCDTVFVTGLPLGADALKFGAASVVGSLAITGQSVRGTVTCTGGMVLDVIVMVDCPACHLAVGAVTSLDRVHVNAGTCEMTMVSQSIAIEVQVWGSATVIHNSTSATATVAVWECRGGRSEYNGQGVLPLLKVFGGLFTLENSTADAVQITTTNQYGGTVIEGVMDNATWSTYNRIAGNVDISGTIIQGGDVAV